MRGGQGWARTDDEKQDESELDHDDATIAHVDAPEGAAWTKLIETYSRGSK